MTGILTRCISSPPLAAIIYVCAVVALVWAMGSAVADLTTRHEQVNAAKAMLDQLDMIAKG